MELELRAPGESDPLQWWSRQEHYRLLWPLARMFLGIPASNTSAERLFSSAGWLADGRENLEITTLEDLAVIRHFLLTNPDQEVDRLLENVAAAVEEEEELEAQEQGDLVL